MKLTYARKKAWILIEIGFELITERDSLEDEMHPALYREIKTKKQQIKELLSTIEQHHQGSNEE